MFVIEFADDEDDSTSVTTGPSYIFSFMSRRLIGKLPEPFRVGIQTSKLWHEEQKQGGLAITNCLSIYMPKKYGRDAIVQFRLGCDEGWNLLHEYGLGDPYLDRRSG